MSIESQLKLDGRIRDRYERCKVLKESVAAVNAATHQFVTDLDMYILATGLVEDVGLSAGSWNRWLKAWDVKLQRAEIFVQGKQIEYGVNTPSRPELEPIPEGVAMAAEPSEGD